MFGLVEELFFEFLEGGGSHWVLWKLAGKGIKGFFGGVTPGEMKLFRLNVESAFGTILFLGAEKEGGVFDEVVGLNPTARNLTKGFLTKGGEDGFGELAGTFPNQVDESVGFLSSTIDAFIPTFVGVVLEKLINLTTRDGRYLDVLKTEIKGVVIGAFPEPDKEVFLLIFGKCQKWIGRFV